MRSAEIAKYATAYLDENYRMGPERTRAMQATLAGLDVRGSLLDVGCGRGELLDMAEALGFDPVMGAEVVPDLIGGRVRYAEAHALPFKDGEIDVVCCIDVMEHLTPSDTEPVLNELRRVAGKRLLVSAADYPSRWGELELHVNLKDYDAWRMLVARHCGQIVQEVNTGTSKLWVVDVGQ